MERLLATAALGVLVACGGSTPVGTVHDAGADSGDGSSGIGGGGGCPGSLPRPGSACSPSGISCEYGSDPNPQCDVIVTCRGSSGWSAPPPGFNCVPGTCPASYASVPQGQDCSPQGLDCAYPEGQCNCAQTVPVTRPNPVWQCSTPASGCPEPRPREGTTCTSPGLTCDYGACRGGVSLECSDGYWRVAVVPCPA
ncbi:MAG TPA: hypothetical protein VF765_26665 [Polyangiaceae bacterium]